MPETLYDYTIESGAYTYGSEVVSETTTPNVGLNDNYQSYIVTYFTYSDSTVLAVVDGGTTTPNNVGGVTGTTTSYTQIFGKAFRTRAAAVAEL